MTAARMALLSGHARLASQDLDEVRQQCGQVFCAHDLQVVGQGQVLDTRLYYRPLGQIGLGRLGYGATVDIDPGALDRFYLLQWPLHGGETIQVGDREVDSSARTGSLVSPQRRFRMRHGAGTDKLFVRIERHALERLADQWAPGQAQDGLWFEPDLPMDSQALASLRALLGWMFREATQGVLLDQPLLAARIEEALLLALLQLLPHSRSRLWEQGPMVAPGFVRRAEEYMAAQAHEALTVAGIAAHAGVGIRSLYAGFQRYRGKSPMQCLRALRLERAHTQLQQPDAPHASVTQVALHWGFVHLGQFAADYKARFGELPSQTLRGARGTAPTPCPMPPAAAKTPGAPPWP